MGVEAGSRREPAVLKRMVRAQLRVTMGEKPPPSEERTQELAVLKDLVQAFEAQDNQAWHRALEKLKVGRCITQVDIDEALADPFLQNPQQKDREFIMKAALEVFMKHHAEKKQKEQ